VQVPVSVLISALSNDINDQRPQLPSVSHLATVDVPWPNFVSRPTEFGTKFVREVPLFLQIPNFL